MSERSHIQFGEQEANLYATGEDVCRTVSENPNSLYQLSFLLTRDHEKAERCFVAGLENLIRGNRTFNQWARQWAKRIVIENAIRELKPRPHLARPNPSATVSHYTGRLSSPPDGHFKLKAILALEDLERFVFVISVLEHYSEHACARFLECTVLEIREASTRALENLINSLHLAFPHNQIFIEEAKT